ncbi:MAG: 4Fe-4S dicluster domain-containing protein [Alphaproteobacteria bacterium]|nr:4Fe-4S dicluster domain-containing protein [Alphaproteobacteria bacterium]
MVKRTISDIANCTGCGACNNICPKNAISMAYNEEGFLYPQIDNDKCVNCGLCFTHCPTEHPIYINSVEPDCMAIAANDELRKQSSSGAVFPLLAEYILEQCGYVCGAAWTADNLVEHIIISENSDLYKLKSSKYLQSDIKEIYKQIKEILVQEKFVLFSGTPCQVAGLNAYLDKQYDRLLTVDIVCHGVPSPKVYKKYLQELVKNSDEKIIKTNFRDKTNGWNRSFVTTETQTDIYTFPTKQDVFMNAFLHNMCLRDSCSQCPFAKFPRQGDITLGDFWGINKYSKKLNDKKGLSLVLANTDKGKTYIRLLKDQTKIFRKVPIKYAIKGNPCLVRSSIPHKDRNKFFARLDNMGLKDNVRITLGEKFDCGILNFWFGSNYGAMLTCYALQETLKELGQNPRVINYIPSFYLYNFKKSKSFDFANKYLCVTQLCQNKNDLRKLNEQTDTFIVGSDQVWRHPYFWHLGANVFQLSFAESTKKKIACAASFGTDHFEGNYEDTQITKYYIKQFDHISVREDDGVDVCRNTFGMEATHILDPVFMVSKEKWNNIIDNSTLNEQNFIASYVLDKRQFTKNILSSVKKYFSNIKSIDMGDSHKGENTSVEDWLYAVKNCKLFVTDSFHGACFAIIFNKPFICLANKSRGYSRFKSLFKTFSLENRMVLSEDANIEKIISCQIDWNKINQTLKDEVSRSKQWLENALNTPIKEKSSDYDAFDLVITRQEMLKKQLELPSLKKRYIKSYILSKVLWGKKKKKYQQRTIMLKQEIKMLKN